MAKKPPIGIDPMLTEIVGGIALLKTETDRGAALVGAAMLDEGLRSALGMYFEPDVAGDLLDEGNSPLHPFSSRIKMAYALTIVARDLYLDLDVIRSVRNEAAHFDRRRGAGFNTGFHNASIKDRVLNMKTVSRETRHLLKDTARLVYELFCITLSVRLHAAVAALHEGMDSKRFGRDNARRGIRDAVGVDKFTDGLTGAAAGVHAEMAARRQR